MTQIYLKYCSSSIHNMYNYDISSHPLFLPSILLKPGATILSLGKVVSRLLIFFLASDEMQLDIVVPCALERQEMGFGKK